MRTPERGDFYFRIVKDGHLPAFYILGEVDRFKDNYAFLRTVFLPDSFKTELGFHTNHCFDAYKDLYISRSKKQLENYVYLGKNLDESILKSIIVESLLT